jgi:hypothetical protein
LAASPGTVAQTYADGAARPAGVSGVFTDSCVLMQNGNVLVISRGTSSTSQLFIYNPTAGTVTAGPVAGSVNGGIQLPDGTVLLIPYSSPTFGIYNPTTGTLTQGLAHGFTGTGLMFFTGATLGLDGNVYLMGGEEGTSSYYNLYEYNYTAQTLTVVYTFPSTAFSLLTPFHGLFTLPNGNILLSPDEASGPYVYSPTTGVMTAGPATNGGEKWNGCLLPNGNVLFTPTTTNIVHVYNPTLNAVTELTNLYNYTTLTGTNFFCASILQQDGNVALIPRDHTNILIVNPTTGAVTVGPAVTLGSTTDKYRNAVMMSNGQILMLPGSNGTNFGLYTPYTGGAVLPVAYLTSRFSTKF